MVSEKVKASSILGQIKLILSLLGNPTGALEQLAIGQNSPALLGWGPMRLAVVGRADQVAILHSMPNDAFRWGHKFNVLGFVVGPESLIVSDGVVHRKRRRAVTPAFAKRRLDAWQPLVLEEADLCATRALRSTIGGKGDLAPALRRLSLGVVVRAQFGESMAHRLDEISDLFEGPQAYLELPGWKQLPHRIPGTTRARVRRDRQKLAELIQIEIDSCRADGGQEGFVLGDLVATGELTDSEIVDQSITLIGAGYDTTAAGLSWAVWAATCAGLWDALAAEAQRAFHDATDSDLLSRLPLADAVMRETMRLYPPGVVAPREARLDLKLGDQTIKKGTLILWSPWLAGRDPAIWEDPTLFDPARFVGGSFDRVGWVPFGGGARKCIGFALAQMEMTLALSRLAMRLRLTPTCDEPPAPRGVVVNRPTGGVVMEVAARESGGV